jgi:tripartite ATP-independent transporter DctM subunit
MIITIFVASLVGAMLMGIPIAFSLVLSGIALMYYMDIFDSQIVAQNIVNGADSFILLAVPFFMLAGEFMNAGGLSRRIINLCMAMVGHVRGGLGYVAIAAAILMASLSGSAVADTAALATLLLPLMRRAGYDVNRSAGLIASGGIIAPVIPPSIGFIIFGVVGGVSITKLFLAGIVPGLLMGLGLVASWFLVSRKESFAPAPRVAFAEVLRIARDSLFALGLPVIIVGGLKLGLFTPTEAAAVAATYALLVGMLVYRELKPSQLYSCILAASKMTAVVMFLVAAALVSSWLITVADLPGQVVALLEPLMAHQTLLMLAIMVLLVIVGTAMDFVPTVLILTPVLMPLIKQAGIDPVFFGVLFIMNNAIGLITPPVGTVGTVVNVVCGVARITMDDVMKGIWPFFLAQLVILLILTLFPSLTLIPLAWLGGS